MRKNNKKSNKKIQNILVFAGFSAIILIVSTYAWFIGLQEVLVNEFKVEIASTDNLLISMNGLEWAESITLTESDTNVWEAYDEADADASQSYNGHTNSWGNGLVPISTAGNVDVTTSKLELFEKGSYTHTGGGFRLVSDRLANNTAGHDSAEVNGYVAFDMFIKNFTGAQYIEEYNPADEERIYLLTDSGVIVSPSGNTADDAIRDASGIENSVRIAFAQIGRVDGLTDGLTTADDGVDGGAVIAGIHCGDAVGAAATDGSAGAGVTGICEDAVIYEPNERNHEDNAIDWFTRYCDQREANDAEGNAVYTDDTECLVASEAADGTITGATFADDIELATYAVNGEITSAIRHDIYDGHNGYDPLAVSAVEVVDTFTDAEKVITGASRPEFMTLAPNSITKIRVYIYLEGNDLDNMDLSAIGSEISVRFGFTKQQLTQADFMTP